MMKAVLKIGYDAYLMPSIDDVTKVVKLMSKAVAVDEHLYRGSITITPKELKFEVLTVPSKTKFHQRDEEGRESPVASPTVTRSKRLTAGANVLRLTSGD